MLLKLGRLKSETRQHEKDNHTHPLYPRKNGEQSFKRVKGTNKKKREQQSHICQEDLSEGRGREKATKTFAIPSCMTLQYISSS